jgi:hypothetical protein
MLIEERQYEIGARLEHTSQKSLRHRARETGILKSSAAKAMKLHRLQPYKVTSSCFATT